MLQSNRPGELIDALGGTAAVARLLGVRSPSVAEWRKNGIPDARLWRLAVVAEQRGLAWRWMLCPDDWFLIWPELIGADGAPPVPATQPKEAAPASVASQPVAQEAA